MRQSTLFQLHRDRYRSWKKFHADNPQVFELFVRFTSEALAAGRQRFGARMIGERIRWYCAIETKGDERPKLNDHHWPYYARLAMLVHPEFAGLFERRDSQFDATDAELLESHRELVN